MTLKTAKSRSAKTFLGKALLPVALGAFTIISPLTAYSGTWEDLLERSKQSAVLPAGWPTSTSTEYDAYTLAYLAGPPPAVQSDRAIRSGYAPFMGMPLLAIGAATRGRAFHGGGIILPLGYPFFGY